MTVMVTVPFMGVADLGGINFDDCRMSFGISSISFCHKFCAGGIGWCLCKTGQRTYR